MPEGKKRKPAWLTGEPEETRGAGQQIPRTGNRTGGRKGPLAEDDTGELLAAGSVKTAVAEENASANASAQTNTIPRVGMPGAGSGASAGANAGRQSGGNSAREIFEEAGIEVVDHDRQILTEGWSIHELGTARMGNDPRTSVLNDHQQSHDVKNLFVVDGSSHVSASCQNPTWTIMALAWRSCEYLASELGKGNL